MTAFLSNIEWVPTISFLLWGVLAVAVAILFVQRRIAIQIHTPTRKDILSVGLLAALIICIFMLMSKVIPADNKDVFNILVGALLMRLADVYTYEFGTTRSTNEQAARLQDVTARAIDLAQSSPPPDAPPAPVVADTVEVRGDRVDVREGGGD